MFLYFSKTKLGRAGLAPEENAAAEVAEDEVEDVAGHVDMEGESTTLLEGITKLCMR